MLSSVVYRRSTDTTRDDCTRRWGKAQPVVPGEDSYERLKHQIHFLHERGLTTPQMDEFNRQLLLLDVSRVKVDSIRSSSSD